ncbi:FUSC family protein [Peribacillus glennii]|uniref:Aromatic acid exporter family protein n=1 Tax=Peribacillus glennii TaxID=2303991 RepID=A0A372LGG5_9BACI|nr:aromatic acid exporter family protein [Peribacillus glennii]RFU65032.1 aromatic acid exporter family protein [Peribacillus glennii]
MILGPRVLKTGIAVTISLLICSILNLQPAVFAGVAAVFTIQPSVYRTWRHLLDQIVTNVIGALTALFSIYFLGDSPIMIGLVMILVISLCLKLNMEGTIPLTLVTVLAIMSAPANESLDFILNRCLIIFIGVACAMVVNFAILPPNYKKNYLNKVNSVFTNLSLLLRTAISNEMKERTFQEHHAKLIIDIGKLEEQYKLFNEERGNLVKLNELNVREIVVFKQMLKTIKQGEQVLENINEHYFQSRANDQEDEFFDRHLEDLIKDHEYVLLKFEGKIKVDENDVENGMMKKSEAFFEQILHQYLQNKEHKFRLMIIASFIVEYSYQLRRLNQLTDQYQASKKD